MTTGYVEAKDLARVGRQYHTRAIAIGVGP